MAACGRKGRNNSDQSTSDKENIPVKKVEKKEKQRRGRQRILLATTFRSTLIVYNSTFNSTEYQKRLRVMAVSNLNL